MKLENNDINNRFIKVSNSTTFKRILRILKLSNKKVLDIGCGYGEYLYHFGQGSIGITTTVGEVDYGRENNLNIVKGNIEEYEVLKNLGLFECIWANNLFEHLLSPHNFLIKLKTISNNKTILILGVPVIPKCVSLLKLNKFRGALASNHISFFTKETLRYTVQFSGWETVSLRPFIFSNIFLDNLASFFAPHLYLIANNNADFRYPEKKQKEWKGEKLYSELFNITENNSYSKNN